MNALSQPRVFEFALVVGAPLALALLELVHPQRHDLFHLDLGLWLGLHYLQVALFPLSAPAMVFLVRRRSGFAAWLCQVAMFVFGTTYVAFDTAAGVVTGILIQAAQASGTLEAWRAPIMAIWTHPAVGGAPGSSPLLAAVGTTT